MKVAIFAGYYYPRLGGYIKNIGELAKRLVAKGYEVKVITCDTEHIGDSNKDGVKVVRLPALDLVKGTYPVPLISKKLLNSYDADVVITQTRFFATSLFGMLYANYNRIPLIHVERGSCHTVSDSRVVRVIVKLYDHTLGSLIVKSAVRNIGVSQAACAFVEHLGGKATVVHNGIELFLEGHTISRDIVFVGRLIYAKGVQDLITAFNRCLDKLQDSRLIIIGDGDYANELKMKAGETVASDRILFYGAIQPSDVIKILCKCNVFVNPSYSEGLPTSVMEAASIGLPIIATDVGGTNEIIEHGKSGLLFKPHDIDQLTIDLLEVFRDRQKAFQMGSEAMKSMRAYSWDSIVNQYDEILKEIKS